MGIIPSDLKSDVYANFTTLAQKVVARKVGRTIQTLWRGTETALRAGKTMTP